MSTYICCTVYLFALYTNYISLVDNLNSNYLISKAKDYSDIGKDIVGSNNMKINGVDVALAHVRLGVVCIGVMTTAAKIVNSYMLPNGGKLNDIIGMGAASLIRYKMVSNNLSNNRIIGSISMKIYKINSSVYLTKPDNNNDNVNKLIADDTNSHYVTK